MTIEANFTFLWVGLANGDPHRAYAGVCKVSCKLPLMQSLICTNKSKATADMVLDNSVQASIT